RARDGAPGEAPLPAVRAAGEPARLSRRAAGRRRLCAPARRACAARRRGARARARGGAARGGARAPSLPHSREIAAQLRPLGLSAAVARPRAQAPGQPQARGRRRPAELFVRLCPVGWANAPDVTVILLA